MSILLVVVRALGCGAIQIRLYTEQAGPAVRLRALGPYDRGNPSGRG